MEKIFEDEKQKFIKEFNNNCRKYQEVERLINVLKIIKKNKEGIKMPDNKKLTDEQIEEIKSRIGEPLSDLAKEYGVTAANICYHQKKVNKGRRAAERIVKTDDRDKKIEEKTLPQPEEPLEVLLDETMSFEDHLFELAAVHNKKITITIEIN